MNKPYSACLPLWLLCLGMIAVLSVTLSAQTIISGDIAGTVTDPTGAALPNAAVTLTSSESGSVQTVNTDATGGFRFALLRPGIYKLQVSAAGFAPITQTVTAVVGQVVAANVRVSVKGTSEVVEVTGAMPLLQTESANLAATYTPKEIELTPNPGGDLTNYALATPGVVLSTGAGYANFTAYGMPGTSNLYTINGGDMNDPYSNQNNSGSSNNMLGANEIQELTIVHNGYTGQYGRAASVNMNFTTKSGSNQFHGNAKWDWNGRYLNANDWFNKQAGNDRPFANSNQWGGSFGGPIIKNKLFFFFDSEGLRYVLPGGGFPVYVPTTQFANAVEANIQATQPNELATYQKMFQLYAGAPGATNATPNPGDGGCGDLAGTASGTTVINGTAFGTGAAPCTQTFRSLITNLNVERLMSIRVDYTISDRDRLNGRYWQDRGTQPTFTDPINSAFNSLSVQPQDAGQLTETHVFTPRLINQLIVGGFYYSALFGPQNLQASVNVFPTEVGGSHNAPNNCSSFDGLLTCMGGEYSRYPQGRNVGQYQAVDDLSYSRGSHELKFGVNFRRINFATYRPSINQTGVFNVFSMTDFANGTLVNGSNVTQQFHAATHYGLNSYSMGLYAQDEWRVSNQLKLTLSLRADRNSNETCLQNCFAQFSGGFDGISHDVNTPYNQSIVTGKSQLFPGLERLVWQPRFGFAYSPRGTSTVIRGGVGVFSDLYPAQISDLMIVNAPTVSIFQVNTGPVFGAAGAYEQTAAFNAAFHSAFASGGTLNSIKQQIPTFTGPNFYTVNPHFVNPKYTEWNLEVQQAFGTKMVATLGYVGNHGSDLIVQQNGINAYCRHCPFGTLPTAAPDPRFGRVRELTNQGISNYNGLTATFTRRLTKGLQGSVNYTWSHTLDDISNAGIDQYSFNTFGESFLYQIDPKNLAAYNYGNADYDFRHNFSASYIYEMPFGSSGSSFLKHMLGGWVTSGVFYKRSGQPYSVVDTSLTNAVTRNNSANVVMPYFLGGSIPSCKVNIQCLNPAQFTETGQNTFGNLSRNQFVGPGYFNFDMTLKKNFRITESGLTFSMGANAYNILNHPRFANPDNNFADAGSTFGQIQSTVTPASSPYGNFQGSAVSGRVLQLELEVKF